MEIKLFMQIPEDCYFMCIFVDMDIMVIFRSCCIHTSCLKISSKNFYDEIWVTERHVCRRIRTCSLTGIFYWGGVQNIFCWIFESRTYPSDHFPYTSSFFVTLKWDCSLQVYWGIFSWGSLSQYQISQVYQVRIRRNFQLRRSVGQVALSVSLQMGD